MNLLYNGVIVAELLDVGEIQDIKKDHDGRVYYNGIVKNIFTSTLPKEVKEYWDDVYSEELYDYQRDIQGFTINGEKVFSPRIEENGGAWVFYTATMDSF